MSVVLSNETSEYNRSKNLILEFRVFLSYQMSTMSIKVKTTQDHKYLTEKIIAFHARWKLLELSEKLGTTGVRTRDLLFTRQALCRSAMAPRQSLLNKTNTFSEHTALWIDKHLAQAS